jgi:hypothetical protein
MDPPDGNVSSGTPTPEDDEADANLPSVSGLLSFKRVVVLLVALAASVTLMPHGASATTGIEVTFPVRVTITDVGVVFTPALRKLHPDTDTTYHVRVINKASTKHAFRIGYRTTKPLAKGASEDFFFTFHAVGKVPWRASNTTAPTARGIFDVKLSKGIAG